MMMGRSAYTLLVCLLLSFWPTTLANEDIMQCVTTEKNCTEDSGFSSVAVINDNFYCCAAGYSMRWNQSQCSCKKTSEVKVCLEGARLCVNATGSDDNVADDGVVRCCPNGLKKQTFTGRLEGRWIQKCSCSQDLIGEFSVITQHYSSANFTNYHGDPGFNISRLELEGMREDMEQGFQNLARLNSHLDDVESYLDNLFHN